MFTAPRSASDTSTPRRPAAAPARCARFGFVVAAACALAVPAVASAQGVKYTQRSKTEMGGAMGAMMSAMGQGGDSETRTSILGSRMRSDDDDGKQSTVIDMESGVLLMLNHDDRTFVRTTFEEMAAQVSQMRADMQERMGGDMPETSVTAPELVFTQTDDRERIEGYEARRTIMTVTASGMLPFAMPGMEGMPGMPPGQEGTSMTTVMVNDMWMSSEVPGMEMSKELREKWSGTMSGALDGIAPALGNMMSGASMEGAEMGVPLRTVSSTVMVPEGVEFDLQAVLDGQDEPMGGGGGLGAMARAMMGGRGGGGDAGGQSVFMRITTEVTDIDEGGVDPSIFEVPENYREITFQESIRRD